MKSSDAAKVAKLLLRAKTLPAMKGLVEDLLTEQEIEAVAERIEIFSLLLQGTPHREIAERLQCGVATVTRGSHELKYGSGVVGRLLKR